LKPLITIQLFVAMVKPLPPPPVTVTVAPGALV
jgi:hypothetical protein